MKLLACAIVLTLLVVGCGRSGAPPAPTNAPQPAATMVVTAVPAPTVATTPSPTSLPAPSRTAIISPSPTASATPAPLEAGEAVIVYNQSGGIAGRTEGYSIYADGRVVALVETIDAAEGQPPELGAVLGRVRLLATNAISQ